MEELEDLIKEMFDGKREEFIKVLEKSFARELCYLCYEIMLRKASSEVFSQEDLFEEFMKEIKK